MIEIFIREEITKLNHVITKGLRIFDSITPITVITAITEAIFSKNNLNQVITKLNHVITKALRFFFDSITPITVITAITEAIFRQKA